jgi:hypothetical protein
LLVVEGMMIESRWLKEVKALVGDNEKSNGENCYAVFPLGCALRSGAAFT